MTKDQVIARIKAIRGEISELTDELDSLLIYLSNSLTLEAAPVVKDLAKDQRLDCYNRVRGVIAYELAINPDSIEPNESIFDMFSIGSDRDLEIVELLTGLEDEFSQELGDNFFSIYSTPAKMADYFVQAYL